jgi:hypothetical protein
MPTKTDPALAARVARLEAALRLIEWTGGTAAKPCCHICHRRREIGHTPECPIGQALAESGLA